VQDPVREPLETVVRFANRRMRKRAAAKEQKCRAKGQLICDRFRRFPRDVHRGNDQQRYAEKRGWATRLSDQFTVQFGSKSRRMPLTSGMGRKQTLG